MLDVIESKLFGIGLEIFTAGSVGFCFGYAITCSSSFTFETGLFYPIESVADKISPTFLFIDKSRYIQAGMFAETATKS